MTFIPLSALPIAIAAGLMALMVIDRANPYECAPPLPVTDGMIVKRCA